MAAPHDSVTTVLAPARRAFLRSVWEEQHPKLGLDSSSRVYTSDVELAQELLAWLKDSAHDLPHSITITKPSAEKAIDPTLNINLVDQVPDDSITHAYSHVGVYQAEQTGDILKSLYYSLVPKGIAIVTVTKRNPIADILGRVSARLSSNTRRDSASPISLRELAEAAQFERGKTRLSEQSVLVQGKDLARLRADLDVIMDKAFGQQGDGQSWESLYHDAWEDEVRRGGGGLRVECWVLVCMKWDLLCA
jgi:hypothetical protein